MIHELSPEAGRSLPSGPEFSVSIFDERESSVRSYCRSFPATFVSAKGPLLIDTEGRSYIDFLSGAGALNYGHNPDSIKLALVEYLLSDGIAHGLDLHTTAKGAFLQQFTDQILKPRGLDYKVQFTGPTGTNAVEAAMKIARKATGRTGIFSFMGGYHGHSLGSLAATANRAHRDTAGVALGGVTFVPFPYGAMANIDTLAYLRALLIDTHSGVELPAAVIVETVQAEGGVVVAPTPWLQELRAICDDYGIVLIVDEVQTGCGRTGPFFSFERAGIVPDIVTVSKSISGYGLPMALALVRPALDVLNPGDHTGTFRGNQLAFVGARAALDLVASEDLETRTVDNGTTISRFLHDEVVSYDHRLEVRGIGMIWGVDTAAIDPTGDLATRIAKQCFADGLIVERVGRNDTVLKILPPLTIEHEQLLEGLTTPRDRDAAVPEPLTDNHRDEPPLVQHYRAVRSAERASFHMPGHKGGAGAPPLGMALFGPAIYEADLSEMGGFDYLHGPESALVVAQASAARLFGASRTWFLVNGATVGNIAAICATVGDGDGLLVARGSHRSVYAGITLSGAHPVYLPPVRDVGLDGLFGVTPGDVQRALEADSRIRAVHVTSPSYYGFSIDLAAIAALTAGKGIPLIVDEAHGSHFAFHEDFPDSAFRVGADIVVHSPHKTLGSLTQSSLLHHQGALVDPARIDSLLQMLQSSSPSALLLLSLDIALDEMAKHGHRAWSRAIELAGRVRAGLAEVSGLHLYGAEICRLPGIEAFDPTKVVVDVQGLHRTGLAAAAWLRRSWQVNPEFSDLRRIVFSVTMGDDETTAQLLVDALVALAASAGTDPEGHIVSLWPEGLPTTVCTPHEGAAARSTDVVADQALGRISAEMIVPYPPGIPLLVAGELITPNVLDSMRQLLAAGCRMVGMSDPSGARLRCVSD